MLCLRVDSQVTYCLICFFYICFNHRAFAMYYSSLPLHFIFPLVALLRNVTLIEKECTLISRAGIFPYRLIVSLRVVIASPSGPLLRGELPVRQMETQPGHNVLLIYHRKLTGSQRYPWWFEVKVASRGYAFSLRSDAIILSSTWHTTIFNLGLVQFYISVLFTLTRLWFFTQKGHEYSVPVRPLSSQHFV